MPVCLMSRDAVFSAGWYRQDVDFSGYFPLPNVKYFDIENVLPGRYVAFGCGGGKGLYTTTAEVNVTTHVEFIYLRLVHKN